MDTLSIAAYFFKKTDDKISTMKMLYFAQGYFLKLYDKPLYDEEIQAWKYGPVVQEVFEHWDDVQTMNPLIPQPIQEYLDALSECYANKKPFDLVDETHKEGEPWSAVFEKGKNNIISLQSIQERFSADNDTSTTLSSILDKKREEQKQRYREALNRLSPSLFDD